MSGNLGKDVDMVYVRGWEDCLDALMTVDDDKELKKLILKLYKLVKQNKFEKVRKELGMYGLF
jgi:hypothetical protein